MIARNKTYLAKHLPEGLQKAEFKHLLDIYFPASHYHPSLRLRKTPDEYQLTKKTLIDQADNSKLLEQSITLSQPEYTTLAEIPGRRISKRRYYYEHEGKKYEIDIFQESLHGLVLVDIEFATDEEKDAFQMPEFCLVEVTQEEFVAGGILCGKSYADIEHHLRSFGYTPLYMQ